MSGISFEEMEAKRQEVVASLRDVAAAMTRCVSIIEDFTRHTPAILLPDGTETELAKAVIGEEKKVVRQKREKKAKDPNAPKRPPSAYILFQNEVRDKMREANPDMAYKDVLTRIAEEWKKLPETEKKVFEDAYQDASVVYRAAEDAYKSGLPVETAVEVAVEESSDSDSDSSDESSDESTPPPVAKPAPVITPQILSSAVAATSSKKDKEKKRKNKDEAAPATPTAGESEKKVGPSYTRLRVQADAQKKKKKSKE